MQFSEVKCEVKHFLRSRTPGQIGSAVCTETILTQAITSPRPPFGRRSGKTSGGSFSGSCFPGRGSREQDREFGTCLLEGGGLMF